MVRSRLESVPAGPNAAGRGIRAGLWPGIARAAPALLNAEALRRHETAIVCAILVLAIGIRIPALLGDGLWRDQANVYVQLAAPNFAEFFRRVIATEWHPPLFFLIMYCWAKVAGTGEFALMILPFTFSIATVGIVYRLGKTVVSRSAGAVAALSYAVAPLAVVYSSEYLYPLMGLLCTLLAWLVARARTGPLGIARFATLGLVSLLVVATHYVGLIYVPMLVLWALTYGSSVRRRITIACALVVGMLPFLAWLPVFLGQRHIGVPYSSATTALERVAFAWRALAEFAPVRPGLLSLFFVAFILVGFVAIVRARAIERDAIALGLIFLGVLAALAVLDLLVSRYALPYYGLSCVFLGYVITRFGAEISATDPTAWRRWGWWTAAFLACALVAGDVASAIATSRTPKSGIRSIVHRPAVDAVTLYVIAPDYLASTFAFYARHARATFAGFVRWNQPEVFRLANYASDWNQTDAVDRTLHEIALEARRYMFLDVVVDDWARDEGRVPYGKVARIVRELGGRYRLLSRTRHIGRYESVSEYRYALTNL